MPSSRRAGCSTSSCPVLRTAYVDAVATAPADQGRGHASAVMRALAANITDYDIACLSTATPRRSTRGWAGSSGAALSPVEPETRLIPNARAGGRHDPAAAPHARARPRRPPHDRSAGTRLVRYRWRMPPAHDTLVFIPAWNEEAEPAGRARRAAARAARGRRPRRRRRLHRRDGDRGARRRRRGALVRREPRAPERHRGGVRVGTRARLRLLRPRRRGRPASGGRAEAAARAGALGVGRRRRRLPLRERRRL